VRRGLARSATLNHTDAIVTEAAPKLDVMWDSAAIGLLSERDRYTWTTILREFTENPLANVKEYDPAKKAFATQVSDGRFTVIWTREDDAAGRPRAVVRAILTLPSLNLDDPDLKTYLENAVRQESRGRVTI